MPKEEKRGHPNSNKQRPHRTISTSSHEGKPYQKLSQNAILKLSDGLRILKHKQWDDISCPICMENPHNAVLLICSQHEKGCRPFMCDTSHRHSNCLDQYRKTQQGSTSINHNHANNSSGDFSSPSLAPGGANPNSDRRRLLVLTHEAVTGGTEVSAFGLLPLGLRQRLDSQYNAQTDGHGEGRFAWRSIVDNHHHHHHHHHGEILAADANSAFEQFRHLRQLRQQQQTQASSIPDEVQPEVREFLQILRPTHGAQSLSGGVAGGGGGGEGGVGGVGGVGGGGNNELSSDRQMDREASDILDDATVAEGKTLIAGLIAKGETVFQAEAGLLCPLCRSSVFGWKVVKDVRGYLDLKSRACSHESCSYAGSYGMLRAHAREVHPSIRPQEANPDRVQEWQRLQRQQDTNDVLSSIQAAMPGARILGDYMIEDNNNLMDNDNEDDDAAEAVDGSDGEGIPAVTDLDFLLPIMDIMSQIAASGPSHQRGRGISWGLNIGPARRRNSLVARAARERERMERLESGAGSASNSPARLSPPRFPVLPPVPLGGAMPSGDPTVNPVRPRSRWGDIRDPAGQNQLPQYPEFLPRGRGRSADPPELLEHRQRMVSELFERRDAIRRQFRRAENSSTGGNQHAPPL